MSNDTALALPSPENRTVKDWLTLPAYRDRFTEVLGKRGPQFMAAITAVSQMPGLRDAKPLSIIASAMVAATLDLPVNPTLGQAYIVAYSGEAQFQIGYKGLIQLALRSGQYRRMNAGPVNAEVFAGYDGVGEPKLDWAKFDPAKEVGGYFCAFELVNGFTKVVYWSKVQAEAHAKRFSKAYQKGYATPWKSDFDSMATKTVIKNALTKWGMLSVEMQKAVVHDQGVQLDVESEVQYPDGEVGEVLPGDPVTRAPIKERAKRGASAVKENREVVVTEAEQAATAEPAPKAAEPAAPRTLLSDGETLIVEAMVTEFKVVEGHKVVEGKKIPVPYVSAVIDSTALSGDVIHSEGSIGADAKPISAWQLDRPVRLALRGKKYTNGVTKNVVQAITILEAAPDTAQTGDEV